MTGQKQAYKYAQPDSTIELPDGTKARLYDLGDHEGERYTAVIDGPAWGSRDDFLPCLGFNEIPWSPNMGISMFSECMEGNHLGKRIAWSDLPEKLQNHVLARLTPREEDIEKFKKNQAADSGHVDVPSSAQDHEVEAERP